MTNDEQRESGNAGFLARCKKMILETDLHLIGSLGKPHGFSGEISLTCPDGISILPDGAHIWLRIDGLFVPFFVKNFRPRNDSAAYIKIEGVDSAEQAKKMNGLDVWIERLNGEKEPARSNFSASYSEIAAHRSEIAAHHGDKCAEILGYTLYDDVTQCAAGMIEAVDNTTANTLFCVAAPNGREILVPAHSDLIVRIDREARAVVMRLPEGLLDGGE